MNFTDKANFIWSVADLLRGDFKQSEYGKVILPFTVLRRFDCVLAPSKEKILELNKSLTVQNKLPVFKKITGNDYYNISKFDFEKLVDDSLNIDTNLRDYINGFSDDVKEILDNFEIFTIIDKLKKSNLLYLVVQKFAELDLGADTVDNLEMGYMYEELIRKFSELSNETAGEHFTPREVIELMVELLFDPDMDELSKDGKVVTIFDPACGTGGMLSVAQNKMLALNNNMTVIPFGQELNPETYATCKSDMILKGNNNSRIVLGNSFNEDGFAHEKFDYMLSNPPFGVEWKKVEKFIKDEAATRGYDGRFGAGTPRISDGSLLFLQHMISKMNAPKDGGSRIAIVFNGSPLFTGDAGSGESEIRRWLIENDMLEAIVALPDQLFYNTGISTYIWIITNRKEERRKGKVRLINGITYFEKMRKSLGNKRNLIDENSRKAIVNLYATREANENYIDFDNEDFGYRKITVERPLRLAYSTKEEKLEHFENVDAYCDLRDPEERLESWKAQGIYDGTQDPSVPDDYYPKLQKALREIPQDKMFMNIESFEPEVIKVLKKHRLSHGKIDLKFLLPLLSEQCNEADIVYDKKGNKKPDTNLRDTETVPLKEDIHKYFEREVLPHIPDAWIDESKTKIGYEIPFTRYFYKFTPLRNSAEIIEEIKELETKISEELSEVFGE
ncbi:SAM-dependent DNA methyltransferase [Lachnospiraceae bacterium MD329]|nr:SAM-dependent DNA methyltransferase [Lachnospiraceae bacterium MD329]